MDHIVFDTPGTVYQIFKTKLSSYSKPLKPNSKKKQIRVILWTMLTPAKRKLSTRLKRTTTSN